MSSESCRARLKRYEELDKCDDNAVGEFAAQAEVDLAVALEVIEAAKKLTLHSQDNADYWAFRIALDIFETLP